MLANSHESQELMYRRQHSPMAVFGYLDMQISTSNAFAWVHLIAWAIDG